MDRGNAFSCMKYTLILCNVFGFILAIFNALFGIGYPQEKWPGGYTGGQMAIFSLFVMAFTTIGYCGAQHHKGYLLIVYGKHLNNNDYYYFNDDNDITILIQSLSMTTIIIC